MIFKKFIIIFLLGLYGCSQVNEIVRYKTYHFNEYIQLDSLVFKPFKDKKAFKSKITFNTSSGKSYSFYGLVYKSKNYFRIFAYSFFGKKIIDIFFGENNYIVEGNKSVVYLITNNNIDKKLSLFSFLKEILKGIRLTNAKILKNCISGEFYTYRVISCESDNYKKVFFYSKEGSLEREFYILNDNHIILKIRKNILEIKIKDNIKLTDFKKEFFDYIKGFKIISLPSLKYIEDNLLKN